MKINVKKTASVIGILLVVLIVVALVAPFLIPEGTYKSQIQQRIQKITGREVAINGKLRLKFFPIVGAYAENVTLANPKDFPDPMPLLSFKSMEVGVAVIPLLEGRIDVSSLTLDEPQINLHMTAKGDSNWLFSRPADAKNAVTEKPNKKTALPLPRNMLLSNVKLTDGTVNYTNDATHAHWSIDKLKGSIELNGLNHPFSVKVDGEWNHQMVSVKGDLDTLDSLMKNQPTSIALSIDSDLEKMSLEGILNSEHYLGTLKLSSPSLKELLPWAVPGSKPVPSASTLAAFIKGDVDCMPYQLYCALTKSTITVDNLTVNGDLKAYVEHDLPHVEADLTANMIDINAFLPPQKQAALMDNPFIPAAFADTAEIWSHTPFDLSSMQSLNAVIRIKNDGIDYRNVHIGANTFHLKLEQQRLGVDLTEADLYGGKANLSANLNVASSAPILETHIGLKDVQAGPLLKDATGNERIDGKVNVETSITGYGNNVSDMVSNLIGNGKVAMQDGLLHGVNLGDMLHNVQAAFGGSSNNSSAETKITSASGSFTIAKGIITNNDLTMALTGMQATGKGTVDLPSYTVNYVVTPQLVNSSAAAGSQAGLSVPVAIEGSLDNPSYRPDVKSAVKNALKNPSALKSQLKNSKGVIKGLKNALQGM